MRKSSLMLILCVSIGSLYSVQEYQKSSVNEQPSRFVRPSEEHPIVGPNSGIDFTSILERLEQLECCCKELTDEIQILTKRVDVCCNNGRHK